MEKDIELNPDDSLAERLLAQQPHRREEDGKKLSLDELESVAGGTRDWATEGCAATVEPGSWCWSDDHCPVIVEHYDHQPLNVYCPKCGMYFYTEYRGKDQYYVCKACNYSEFAFHNTTDKAK